ncbi:MAG: hypothetical protein CMP23_11660 [Rickettsiales bacterium]|nr:hypothetical protein [Rickettsiales bacterium]
MPGDDDDDLSDDDDDLSDDDDDLSDDDDTSGGSALDGDLRLAGTGSGFEGRIEIYYSGQWGTICDDSWGTADAQVACRQLGLPSESAEAVGNAAFGPGDESMEIWLDNVGCSGSEQRIEDCDHDGWQQHNCVHDEDAGVRCL